MSISSSTIDALLARADEILTGAGTKRKVAGFGIGIAYKGKVIYTRGYGFADIAQERVHCKDGVERPVGYRQEGDYLSKARTGRNATALAPSPGILRRTCYIERTRRCFKVRL